MATTRELKVIALWLRHGGGPEFEPDASLAVAKWLEKIADLRQREAEIILYAQRKGVSMERARHERASAR